MLFFPPTQGRAADEKAGAPGDAPRAAGELALFNGKDLSGWKLKNPAAAHVWKVVTGVTLDPANGSQLVGSGEGGGPEGVLFRTPVDHGTDLISEQTFGDCEVHVEFAIPKGSNSGVYLMGQYEVQILSSFGKAEEKLGPGDCGGIYNNKAPSANPLTQPGEWQTFDIVFRAPRFDADGKKTANARFVSVKLNSKEIQKDVEAPKPTGGEIVPGKELPVGPLMFQGDHGIVAFRNVRVKPTDAK